MSAPRVTRRQVLRTAAGLPLLSLAGSGNSREMPRGTHEVDIRGYDTALLPREHGQLLPLREPLRRRYPSRDHCMQMAAFFNRDRGLLVIAKDARGGIADWEIRPGERLLIHFFGEVPEVETVPIAPTVAAAAEGYRRWASGQPWVQGRRRTSRRLNFISMASLSSLALERRHFERVRAEAAGPAAMWLTQWRRYPFDRLYPDYGAREPTEFANTLALLRTSDALALPYINGLLWDTNLADFTPTSRQVQLLTAEKSSAPYSREMDFLRYACPYVAAWQDFLLAVRRGLNDSAGEPCNGVYLDMLAATAPLLCWAEDHGHAPGDPYAWQRGIRSLLERTAGAIMVEGCAEVYLDQVDYLLMHLYTDQTDAVPLWNGVYGVHGLAVGWRLPPAVDAPHLAMAIRRAHEFGVGGFATPWMTSEPEIALFERGAAQAALRETRRLH